MSPTAINSFESARKKFFMNSTYIMSRKKESNRYRAQEAEISLAAISSLESARDLLFMNLTYIMSRK